ncbi:cytochrome c1 [Thiohalorhabdus sp.]|uniref:cytochrome c1 n=1 Tax=Thiohalorhabdus sp. TaxID=3094134 RepID=UPI002FC2A32E
MEPKLDKESLSKGAKTFAQNCMGCHSAKYFRYSNLQEDLGMTKSGVEDELMQGTVNINDKMKSAMTGEQAEAWFGAPAPDLSLVTRVRGADWVYSYLLAFYRADTATGWDNHVFAQVSMPNVLYHLTDDAPGYYDELSQAHVGEDGHVEYPEVPEQLDTKVQNLVSFLKYAADPSILARQSMGPWVLLFLVVLGVLTYLVKKEYWRDIH